MRRLWMAAALSVALAACGDEASSSDLDLDKTSAVAYASQNLSEYCLAELEEFASTEQYRARNDAIDTLVSVYRSSPDGIYQPGGEGEALTMRQVVSDRASSLDSCDPEGAAKLDRALDAGA